MHSFRSGQLLTAFFDRIRHPGESFLIDQPLKSTETLTWSALRVRIDLSNEVQDDSLSRIVQVSEPLQNLPLDLCGRHDLRLLKTIGYDSRLN